MRASEIERLVLCEVFHAVESDALLEQIREEICAQLERLRSHDHQAQIERLESQLARHEDEIARTIREKARTADMTLLKGYDRVLEDLARGVRETELRLAELQEAEARAERALEMHAESLAQVRNLLAVFEIAPLLQKRAILRELIESIRYNAEARRAEVRILLPRP